MNPIGAPLGEFFHQYAERGEPLVLATIAATIGSTYRKAGAQMLIAGDGRSAGLLSGGCLEADLMERARDVLRTGEAVRVEYDTRSSDDLIWGIGLGCEGAMSILLTRLDRSNDYQPFAFAETCRAADAPGSFALVVSTSDAALPLGASYWSAAADDAPPAIAEALRDSALMAPNAAQPTQVELANAAALVAPIERPLRLLVLGAGPDAAPLVEIAALMSWNVVVLDHRPAYAAAERFPRARRVALRPAAEAPAELAASRYDAAVVMSHHLLSDQLYLAALADSNIPYIGLLGPAPRRVRLMSELGPKADKLGSRLFGPVGLDIGARTPETIALAIVGEIQAMHAGRSGRSFSRTTQSS